MSEVRSNHSLEDLQRRFQQLLTNLDSTIKEVSPRFDIRATRLSRFQADLCNLDKLDKSALSKLVEIVVKFNSINEILTLKECYNKKDLLKVITGKADYEKDSNEGYNDSLFEMSMAARFLPREYSKRSRINLRSECDIIIDGSIAIECKYIHSTANLSKNISKARSQIRKRIETKQANSGLIALDLSNVLPRERIESFASYIFNLYISNYEALYKKRKLEGDIVKDVSNDKNFYRTISHLITSELEMLFYGEIGFEYDMGQSCRAIIFQSLTTVCLEYKNQLVPVLFRGMTYSLNRESSKESNRETVKLINQLPTGI